MADAHAHLSAAVNTVLGTVPADSLGVVAIHESLLSVVPGAQYAYDITLDQADIFETIVTKLRAFKAAGGGTVVDNSYVASQQYNEWLAEADKEAKLGWTVAAARAAGDKVRLIVDDNGAAGLNFVVSAKAEHPLGRAPERMLQFTSQGDGSYVSREALPAGRWLLRVEVKRASDRYRMVADIQ